MNNGLYGNSQNTKAQSIRFVVITALVVLVILGVVVWAIVFAVRSKDNSGLAGTIETETSETAEPTENATENTTENTAETSDQGEVVAVTNLDNESTEAEATQETTTEEASAQETTAEAVTQAENIPKTGPEDTIPFAIATGALVAYLGSFKLTRKLPKNL